MPGADGHLLYNAADPGYHRLSLLDIVEGSFLYAGATPGWPTCHRIAVCSNVSGVLAVSAIVSQTGACSQCRAFRATLIRPIAADLVRFLLEHSPRGALGPMANRSLEDLGLVLDSTTMEPRGVLCCDDATPALDAFGLMLSRGVSALGVRSSTSGALVANLSISDLRTVLPDRFGTLALPTRAFLELQAAGGFGGARVRGTAAPRLVTVRADAALTDAMRAIVDHGLHHVFVVDADGAPLAVVSCTDVLKLLVPTA
jgi:CBS domain-containing protein